MKEIWAESGCNRGTEVWFWTQTTEISAVPAETTWPARISLSRVLIRWVSSPVDVVPVAHFSSEHPSSPTSATDLVNPGIIRPGTTSRLSLTHYVTKDDVRLEAPGFEPWIPCVLVAESCDVTTGPTSKCFPPLTLQLERTTSSLQPWLEQNKPHVCPSCFLISFFRSQDFCCETCDCSMRSALLPLTPNSDLSAEDRKDKELAQQINFKVTQQAAHLTGTLFTLIWCRK